MGVYPDWMIQQKVKIEPFSPQETREGIISYGVSSYGYDARVGYKFKILNNVYHQQGCIDPKAFDEKHFIDVDVTPGKYPVELLQYVMIPPNSFALAETIEYFEIPRDVIAICLGKSTYARCGVICNVTPLEPEWHGKITIEISNTTPLPAKIYAGEGIIQVLFIEGSARCCVSYADKKGKYQDQEGLTLPMVD